MKAQAQAGKADESDMSLVFGPGATELEKNLLPVKSDSPASSSDLDQSKRDTSTPLRKPSRGRTRTRNSGRSSQNSPSPIRKLNPPGKKVKLNEDKNSDQLNIGGQKSDLLDPGEKDGSLNVDISGDLGDDWSCGEKVVEVGDNADVKDGAGSQVDLALRATLHSSVKSDLSQVESNAGENLSDSGDWGDTEGNEENEEELKSKDESPPVDTSSVGGTLAKPGS